MNIQFEYLYRDAGNNKKWGDVIFSNLENIEVATINQKIKKNLIDHEFFVAENVGVPDLHFSQHIETLDHGWHEFYNFIATDIEPNDVQNRDIIEFIESFKYPSEH